MEKRELKQTQCSWISVDPKVGDYLFETDTFFVPGHPGVAFIDNDPEKIDHREWHARNEKGELLYEPVFEPVLEPVLDEETGEPVLDDDGNAEMAPVLDDEGNPEMVAVLDEETGEPVMAPVITGEYFLTLWFEHKRKVPRRDEKGEIVRDDHGDIVYKKSHYAEIIGTALEPDRANGQPMRLKNAKQRKLDAIRRNRASEPGEGKKRGRKAKGEKEVPPYGVELASDGTGWLVTQLGKADPVAIFPPTVDGRENARARRDELVAEHKAKEAKAE